ncbi:MAG: ABC transporter permease [Acidimicrobiales bacterium]
MAASQPFFQWSYVTGQWSQISSDLLQHIALSLLSLGIGLVVSEPLALVAWRFRPLRTFVVGLASGLYIIPSLALFAILGPITGYVASYPTALIALVGYTLLILIWNTMAGLDAVPAETREAATAFGYTPTARLLRVDFPLALPYVFAGLRVASATVIGLVTVTALIGLGGLGQQITYGFNIGFYTPIIVGLVLSVALAALCDLLLVGIERLVLPWKRSGRAVFLRIGRPARTPLGAVAGSVGGGDGGGGGPVEAETGTA